jgi:hypothetical protein
MRAVRHFGLDAAGSEVGALFRPIDKAGTVRAPRLTCRSVANIVKAYARRAGFDASTFSGHSLRAGFLTSAAGKGASIFKMMDVSRHKSVDTLRGYVRDAELFKDHAGAGLLCPPMPRGLGKVQRQFLLGLIVPTEALQEPRWLGILHGLRLCLCILDGADLYPILLAPHLRSGIFHDLCSGSSRGPDLCTRILHRPDLLLHGSDLCPCIFLGRPSLVFLEQAVGCWLRIFGVTLIGNVRGGSNFFARRGFACSRRQSLSVSG